MKQYRRKPQALRTMSNPISTERYKSFTLYTVKPCYRSSVRVYCDIKNYKQTCNTLKEAKRLVDFCTIRKIWRRENV